MHESSFEKMRAFTSAYLRGTTGAPIRVLDVGSHVGRGTLSFRSLFGPPTFDYVGLDVVEGHNVDLVPKDTFRWVEIEDESFDVVISNQMLEHNPYFWITVAEMARVLVEGGLMTNIAPSTGYTHRHPLDCWRFYPDSWASLCAYVGLELLESYREQPSWRKIIPGTYWKDAMMVARKPHFDDADERSIFYTRIDAIVATRTDSPARLKAPGRYSSTDEFTAWRRYEKVHVLSRIRIVITRPLHLLQLASKGLSKLKESRISRALRHRIWSYNGGQSLRRGQALMPVAPESNDASDEHRSTSGPRMPDPCHPPVAIVGGGRRGGVRRDGRRGRDGGARTAFDRRAGAEELGCGNSRIQSGPGGLVSVVLRSTYGPSPVASNSKPWLTLSRLLKTIRPPSSHG